LVKLQKDTITEYRNQCSTCMCVRGVWAHTPEQQHNRRCTIPRTTLSLFSICKCKDSKEEWKTFHITV